jgi:hypothetical protein
MKLTAARRGLRQLRHRPCHIFCAGRTAPGAPNTISQGFTNLVATGMYDSTSGRRRDDSACAVTLNLVARGGILCAGEYTGSVGVPGRNTRLYNTRAQECEPVARYFIIGRQISCQHARMKYSRTDEETRPSAVVVATYCFYADLGSFESWARLYPLTLTVSIRVMSSPNLNYAASAITCPLPSGFLAQRRPTC